MYSKIETFNLLNGDFSSILLHLQNGREAPQFCDRWDI